MKAIGRRDLYVALSALVGAGKTTTTQTGQRLEPERSRKTTLSDSEALSPDRLPVATNANVGKSWSLPVRYCKPNHDRSPRLN